MSRSTTYRYLQSLRDVGLVDGTNGDGAFGLGPRVLQLARVARMGFGLSEIALPVMRRLSRQVGETVLLCRRMGEHVVCLEREEAARPIRLAFERGHILPVNAGASAKVLLAWADADDVESLLSGGPLQRFTQTTLVDPEDLRENLATIRGSGYAVSHGERDEGVLGIAAPIRGSDGRVAGSLSIAALEYRVTKSQVEDFVRAVCAAASEISALL